MADRKIFIDDSPKDPDVKTSPFDLTFATNVTGNFGKVQVTFCKYYPPKSHIEIEPMFAFDQQPFVYPVQTNVRCHTKVYQVPIRDLWDDAEDFFAMIGEDGTPTNAGGNQFVVPYIKRPTGWNGKGTLAEQLGCSNIKYDVFPSIVRRKASLWLGGTTRQGFENTVYRPLTQTARIFSLGFKLHDSEFFTPDGRLGSAGSNLVFYVLTDSSARIGSLGDITMRTGRYIYENDSQDGEIVYQPNVADDSQTSVVLPYNQVSADDYYSEANTPVQMTINGVTVYRHYYNVHVKNPQFFANMLRFKREGFSIYLFLDFGDSAYSKLIFDPLSVNTRSFINVDTQFVAQEIVAKPNTERDEIVNGQIVRSFTESNLGIENDVQLTVEIPTDGVNTLRDSINGEDPKDPVSALPFRAVEFIHNYFFRNPRIDPFYKDGKPTYNKFLTNTASGADETTPIETWLSYYETDYFTSCVKEPQMGNAPLVGVTVNDLGNTGILTFSDGQGGINDYTVHLEIDGQGRVLPLSVYDDVADRPNVHRLSELISAGISINDLRNVSTFQRMLERMQRTGYRFENVVFEFFGTNPPVGDRYPKYLGGISRNIMVDKITQMAETSEKKLGQFGGTGKFRYPSQNDKPVKISTYTTEPCYIIGITYFTVTPCYPQYTPRHFYYKDPLDFYMNPEFATIGPQPVYCKELAFGQLTEENLNDVFGYNRPYAEMFSSVDEVHGLFLDNMANFLLQRWFSGKPQLNKSFIEINPLDLTNIYAVTEYSDKIFGQILYRVSGDLPAPRSYLPRSI